MCNCGHEQKAEAQRLKQRSVSAVLMVLVLGFVLISIGGAHPPVLYLGLAVQLALVVSAVVLMRRRRRVLCGLA